MLQFSSNQVTNKLAKVIYIVAVIAKSKNDTTDNSHGRNSGIYH